MFRATNHPILLLVKGTVKNTLPLKPFFFFTVESKVYIPLYPVHLYATKTRILNIVLLQKFQAFPFSPVNSDIG